MPSDENVIQSSSTLVSLFGAMDRLQSCRSPWTVKSPDLQGKGVLHCGCSSSTEKFGQGDKFASCCRCMWMGQLPCLPMKGKQVLGNSMVYLSLFFNLTD